MTCKVKYSNIHLKSPDKKAIRGLHKVLQKMNQGVIEYQKLEDKKNAPVPQFCDWYLDLKNLVETHTNREDVILTKLLKKLEPYGKVKINFYFPERISQKP
jgi:hypothetical protein